MTKGQINRAESKFDKLSNEIAKDYEKKGKNKDEAEEIGKATAYKIGVAKYGKRGMERKARAGRAKNAESFGAESNCSCGNRFINQCYVCDTQICAYCNYNNSAKCDKCYEGDDSHWAEEFGAESFEANAGGLKCNVCQNMVADTDGDKYFVCDTCANDEGMGAESFGAEKYCEGGDMGFCDWRFDWGSSGIEADCQKCNSGLSWYWDEIGGDGECEGGDMGFCDWDFDWDSSGISAECSVCDAQIEFEFPRGGYGQSMNAESFGAEGKTKVTNITNVGNKVIVTMGNDIYEGSMDDVMLNNYTNSRGQEIRFNGEEVPEGFHKMPDGTIMADSAHGAESFEANMSYCRHENTADDLEDVWDKWYDWDEEDASNYEKNGRRKIVRIVREMANNIDSDSDFGAEDFGADGMDFKEAAKTGFGIAAGFTLFNVSLFGIAAVAGIVMSKK